MTENADIPVGKTGPGERKLGRAVFIPKPLPYDILETMADRGRGQLQLTPAKRLNEIYRTVENRPLMTTQELEVFYEKKINEARGDDATSDLKRGLKRQHRLSFFKRFFYGSRGSGKSTEMSCMLQGLEEIYRGVRLDITKELNATAFEPHEIVLALALCLTREMNQVVEETNSQQDLDPEVLYAVQEWFIQAEYTTTRTIERSAEGKFESKGDVPFIKQFLPFAVSASGSLKTSSSTKEEVKEKRRRLYGDLILSVNNLLTHCNELLGACYGNNREWVVIIEDFDKGTPYEVLRKLIFENGFIFRDLETHLICGLTIGVRFGAQGNELALSACQMHDTPVYQVELSVHVEGREGVRAALGRRVDLTLFAPDQAERLIVASGGNLRTLFEMVAYAADRAAARRERLRVDVDAGPIEEDDVTRAINQQRASFRLALGEDVVGENKVTKEAKRDRLKQVYDRVPGHDTPDEVMNDLLIGRLLQYFNGTGRYAVHPIVVDLLKDDPLFNPEKKELLGGLLN